jgi:acyl carrier protein
MAIGRAVTLPPDMSTGDQIRAYIRDSLLEEPFEGDDPLAEEALDSLAVEELIDHLEDEYDILFADEELVRENFGSIATLERLVDAKRAAAAEVQSTSA